MPATCTSYKSIDELLFERAQHSGDREAVLDGDASFTYGVLADSVGRHTAMLIRSGMRAGDHVAIYMTKTVDAVIAIFSVWAAGGVIVPINESLRNRQVRHILEHSHSRFLLADQALLARLDAATVANVTVLHISRDATASVADAAEFRRPVGTPAAILYTSGSTGLPKGILISHANLLAGARIVAGYLDIRSEDRILSVLPFSFDYGLNQLLLAVHGGASLVLQRSHYPGDICRTLDQRRVSVMAAVPALWIQLLQSHSPFSTMRFPHLRCITNSGGVFPREAVRQYRQLIPHTRIYLMYGLSEAFRSSFLPPDEVDIRPRSIGKAIPETRLQVIHESGRECAPGEIGELVHSGPTVALGYWRDPESTRTVFRSSDANGSQGEVAVYSGDLVYKDDEGYLYFAGRRDQLIKCAGYRISPDEVEDVIFSSGAVREAAVCGRPDPVMGMAVVAHVVPQSLGEFSIEAFLTHCRREMPSYMVPKHVVIHAALPRTTTGKIDRSRLERGGD